MAAPHILPSALGTASASVTSELSRLNIPPHTIAVYASWPPSPTGHATLATGRVLALTRTGLSPAGPDQLILTHPQILDGLKRIRKVMHFSKGEHSQGAKGVASRKLWHALHAVDKYLRGQAAWLVNYAKRHRAGLRVGTSITEGTANFLVNRWMNKSQQMRWSRNGADLLLQVRCAIYNGTLGAGFGHRFDRIANADPAFDKAA